MTETPEAAKRICNFCQKPPEEYRMIIHEGDFGICDICIVRCYHMIQLEDRKNRKQKIIVPPSIIGGIR